MIGLLLLYFIAKPFYALAGEHNKSQWGFAILSIVVYYAGYLGGAFVMGIVLAIVDPSLVGDISGITEIVFSLIAIPFGLLACWIFYRILLKQWDKVQEIPEGEVLDSNLFDEQGNR
jgi:hypothetical protein